VSAPALARRVALEKTIRATGHLADDDIDLAGTALALAALDRPSAAVEPYAAHLAEMADAVGARVPGGAVHNVMRRARALAEVLAEEYGYAGDTQTYDDADNANLMRVIDRRRGLPVALGILYMDVARRLGWEISGINFPGHFLIRLERGAMRVIVDPFDAGAERTVADLRALLKQVVGLDAELGPFDYAPIGNRDTLIRLLNNIKVRALAASDAARAAEIVERMMMVSPADPALLREAGMCHARGGNLRRASETLTAFLDSGASGRERDEAAALLREVRQRLN
jgi:regulator of sirC expression with transglutaminase-like and TPR domain